MQRVFSYFATNLNEGGCLISSPRLILLFHHFNPINPLFL